VTLHNHRAIKKYGHLSEVCADIVHQLWLSKLSSGWVSCCATLEEYRPVELHRTCIIAGDVNMDVATSLYLVKYLP
jgi:hypothetical protein